MADAKLLVVITTTLFIHGYLGQTMHNDAAAPGLKVWHRIFVLHECSGRELHCKPTTIGNCCARRHSHDISTLGSAINHNEAGLTCLLLETQAEADLVEVYSRPPDSSYTCIHAENPHERTQYRIKKSFASNARVFSEQRIFSGKEGIAAYHA